jgi:protein phosphatase
LEHPAEAFAYYRKEHVEKVICEQKHMGSRAVVIVCRDRDVALRRFGVVQDEIGVCTTRTGRRFFNDGVLAHAGMVDKDAFENKIKTLLRQSSAK